MKKCLVALSIALATSTFAADLYLGVATEKLDPAFGSQLDIPKGFGLIVRAVDERSKAKDKLKDHDVLLKLNDQHLISPDQLTILIGQYETEETVDIELIRKGKRGTVQLPLSIRPEAPKTAQASQPAQTPSTIEENVLRLFNESLSNAPIPDAHRRAMFGQPSDSTSQTRSSQNSSSSYSLVDNGTSISLFTVNGNSRLTVKMPDGKTVFDGPINSEAELEQVPADIRKKLDGMKRAAGIQN